MYQVQKRDGKVVEFDVSKISAALEKAFVGSGKQFHPTVIDMLALRVTSDFEEKIRNIRETIEVFTADNPKLGGLLSQIVDEIVRDKSSFIGKDIYTIVNERRYAAVDEEIRRFAEKWYVGFDDVKYEALHFRDGQMANENKFKESADYTAYKEATPDAMAKFKFYKQLIREFKEGLMPEVLPLIG